MFTSCYVYSSYASPDCHWWLPYNYRDHNETLSHLGHLGPLRLESHDHHRESSVCAIQDLQEWYISSYIGHRDVLQASCSCASTVRALSAGPQNQSRKCRSRNCSGSLHVWTSCAAQDSTQTGLRTHRDHRERPCKLEGGSPTFECCRTSPCTWGKELCLGSEPPLSGFSTELHLQSISHNRCILQSSWHDLKCCVDSIRKMSLIWNHTPCKNFLRGLWNCASPGQFLLLCCFPEQSHNRHRKALFQFYLLHLLVDFDLLPRSRRQCGRWGETFPWMVGGTTDNQEGKTTQFQAWCLWLRWNYPKAAQRSPVQPFWCWRPPPLPILITWTRFQLPRKSPIHSHASQPENK